MKCLFCGNKLVDATSICTSISKDCEFSLYTYKCCLRYYICINKRIALVDHGWINAIKKEFFRKGTFILCKTFHREEFEFDYEVFLKGGFVF